jgi:Ni2+-binding GTPase involved in maturation of urease and hydrogenase
MHEVTVSMFGPRGVGKTSLLTTMYERFESDTSGANLQITPDMRVRPSSGSSWRIEKPF